MGEKMKIQTDMLKSKTLHFESTFGDKNAYVTITEWANGEGYNIEVNSNGQEKCFNLTYEEFDALISLYHGFGLKVPEL